MDKFTCPSCGTEFEYQEGLVGRKCECQACGTKFVFEAPSSQPRENNPYTPRARQPARGGDTAGKTRRRTTAGNQSPSPRTQRSSQEKNTRPPIPTKGKRAPWLFPAAGILIAGAVAGGFFLYKRSKPKTAPKMATAPLPPARPPLPDDTSPPPHAIITTPTENFAPPPPRPPPPPSGMYSGFDLTGIRGIVEEIEHSEAPWRKKARERIERYRKARMTIQTLDSNGMPAPGVEVSIKLLRHAFHFGGVITVNAFSRNEAAHKKAFSEMGFNSAGFCNSLKYKLNKGKGKKNVKDIIEWLRSKNIYVRGHCLIWPGCGHLPSSISKIVRAKQQDKRKLEETCAAMIAEWAAQWDVDEWDVINEPRGNHDVQDILGYGVEKQWFDIARKHVKNGKKVRLCFNDNRIISDLVKNGHETLTDRILKYRANLERLIQEKAPLDFLGFQSRFATKIPPEIIYERLRVFDKYKLPLVATEFEMRNSIGTEEEKAKYTAVVMTVYFSHPLVDGIYAWSLSPRNDKREIMNGDGSPNLRGKIWLYLTKNRWSTRTILTTGPDGKATTKAFKGTYEIKAKRGNKETTIETNLEDDKTLTIKL